MKKKYYYLILIVGLLACSKEEVEGTTTITTNTIPSILLSKPIDNHIVNLGQTLSLEGLVTDAEGLSSIHYSIESPNASYNYTSSSSTVASGTTKDFNLNVPIPDSASVGEALINVYCTDTDNNQSSTITRTFNIKDNILPDITYLKDSVGYFDIIEIQVYKNTHNVVDSVLLFNQTRSETIATIKDLGGFLAISCNSITYHLLNNFQNIYTYQEI